MKRNIKAVLLLALIAILLLASVGATWAYLVTRPKTITNVFEHAHVDTEIVEVFDGATKSSVFIENKSNIAAFVRVAIVGNWVKDGAIIEPWNGIITPAAGWTKKGSYYYCTAPVAAGASTPNLLGSAITTAPRADGAVLRIDILQQGLQAEPVNVVKSMWDVDPTTLAGGGA